MCIKILRAFDEDLTVVKSSPGATEPVTNLSFLCRHAASVWLLVIMHGTLRNLVGFVTANGSKGNNC